MKVKTAATCRHLLHVAITQRSGGHRIQWPRTGLTTAVILTVAFHELESNVGYGAVLNFKD